jgi:hypothetical protein
MRFLCFLFLVVFAGAAVWFALSNQQEVTVGFLNWSLTSSIAAVVGASYVLGMLSGWTIVGMLRRSLRRVTERPIVQQPYVQAR